MTASVVRVLFLALVLLTSGGTTAPGQIDEHEEWIRRITELRKSGRQADAIALAEEYREKAREGYGTEHPRRDCSQSARQRSAERRPNRRGRVLDAASSRDRREKFRARASRCCRRPQRLGRDSTECESARGGGDFIAPLPRH